MLIKVNRDRLYTLSRRLRMLENDISDITNQVTRISKLTAQSVKYKNTEYTIKRACDRVLDSVDDISRSSRAICSNLEGQSRVLANAVSSYKENDKLEKINNGAMSNIGSNLRRVFGCSGYGVYVTVIRKDLFRYL